MLDTQQYLCVIDVGNTHTVFGIFRDETLAHTWRLSTDRRRTADEYEGLLLPLLGKAGVNPQAGAVVVASVVPPLTPTIRQLSRALFGREALVVAPGIKTGLSIRYDNPAEVGADRIANAVAARALWGAPAIVVDFGTAVTFDIINSRGEYAGGIIAPGHGISAEALFAQATQLYRVDMREPERLIGRNTAEAMQSGLFYGFVGMVDGIAQRLLDELGASATMIATGGNAGLIAEASRCIQEVHPDLTLVGLRLIHELNR